MPKGTRERITDALLDLAFENPSRSDFSMIEIAEKAGITRQAIYQKHFRNSKEIVGYLRQLTNTQIFDLFPKYDPASGENPFDYFAYNILPMFYKKQKFIRCFYTTAIDPGWRSYIRNIYLEWGLNNYNTKGEQYHLSDKTMTKLLIELTMAIVEVWICQEDPMPAEAFCTDFLRLAKTPIYDLLIAKDSS